MIAIIFYFSATGNSQYAAERIAQATNDRVISIGLALKDKHLTFDVSTEERIGFVIPTYAWTVPGIVADFIQQAVFSSNVSSYVYAVLTCGENTGKEAVALHSLLKEKGIGLNASFDLVMPDNFILWTDIPSEDRLDEILASADETIDQAISTIIDKQGNFSDSQLPEDLFMPLISISSSEGTSKFFATEACNGCGLCQELCPMSCIELNSENRPSWEGLCAMCLSCLHRCPVQAVQYGSETIGKTRYINPHVEDRLENIY
ncbi:MAG: hypothetical protein GX562_07540 [Coriobacteriaceae bacterium]|nr:hypothetical protein [Coriobacteriaceae bacterium]